MFRPNTGLPFEIMGKKPFEPLPSSAAVGRGRRSVSQHADASNHQNA